MSVIAKMTVNTAGHFGASKLIDCFCQYDSDLANKDNENYRFTQATPNGAAKLYAENDLGLKKGDNIYLLFSRGDLGSIEGALGVASIRCVSQTDYGGTSKQIELANNYKKPDVPTPVQIGSCNIVLTVDNPQASVQLEPGVNDYWLKVYSADKFTMFEALALAGKSESE